MRSGKGNHGRSRSKLLAVVICLGAFGGALGASDCTDLKEVQARAGAGDGSAQRTLGYWSQKGICVRQSRSEAIHWFELAYRNGHRDSGERLAEIYLDSDHPPEGDVKRALDILNDNAQHGFAESQAMLGKLYAEGVVVKRDYQRAREHWLKAAKTDRTAKYNLAVLYDNGDGVKRDSAKALSLAKEAADAGAISALRGLCGAYVRGDAFGVAGDFRLAYPYCFQAAELDDLPSMNLLGLIYFKTGETDKALTWLRRSADAGQVDAQYALGKILLDGLGGTKNESQQGLKYLERAAAQGHKGARELISGFRNQ